MHISRTKVGVGPPYPVYATLGLLGDVNHPYLTNRSVGVLLKFWERMGLLIYEGGGRFSKMSQCKKNLEKFWYFSEHASIYCIEQASVSDK